ncbi:MAG TPA: 3-deoxy-D-manno-octulosonic acid transferase [Gammaproteobacteria bacterium]|nr:3-deoxy-D-manno-octulosonic acid transferase [Gammaproteobacteria bacterium]
MWQYTLLLRALALPLVLLTAWQAARRGGGWRYFRERLGWPPPTAPGGLWLHAASVGEVNALMPLIHALHQRHPELPLTLSTVTITGAAAARRGLPEGAQHRYLPIDWPGATRRFLRRLRPACGIIMETELWPRLYATCRRRGVKLVIVNARVSARTLNAGPWLRARYAEALGGVTAVLARSEADRTGFVTLGADPEHTRVTGNIKFAIGAREDGPEAMDLGRPYVLAASTHADEERRLAELWLGLNPRRSELLVIAPRHPNRLPAILEDLGDVVSDGALAVRSRGEAVGPDTRVYLADTLGELEALMAGARLVFMGGSLVPVGGHNILEPARLGRAPLFGPYMDNFTDEARLLLEADAAMQFDTEDALAESLPGLLDEPERLAAMGERAQEVLLEHSDIVGRYMARLTEICGVLQDSEG